MEQRTGTGGPGRGGVAESARATARTAQQKTAEAAQGVEQTVKERANTGIDSAAGQLNEVAGVLHETSGRFREQQQSLIADQIDRLAARTQSFSGYLKTHSFEDAVADAESYARRNPMLVTT